MSSVELIINNRSYAIACDAGEEERVRFLGSMVDQRARQLGTAASEVQRLLMVSLLLADELEEAKRTGAAKAAASPPTESDEEHQLLVAAVEHLADRIDHIAASLSQT